MPNAAVRSNDPPYLRAAFSVLGLSEIAGARHEKKVLAMFAASGHPEITSDETPWCAAYVGWSLEEGGLEGTHSLMARSYTKYGKALDKNKIIPRGAIAVWPRAGAPGSGHVNFVLEDDGTYITCLGGNQSNRKGGGVTISRYLKEDAVAFRMPPGVSAPKPVPVPVPKPEPVEPESEPEPETELPDPQALPRPRPQPDEEPVEDEKPAKKPSFFRRALNWLGGLAASAASIALDWRFGVVVAGLIILAVAFLLWLYGKEPIKAFISRNLGMGK